jgi:hypothetical protein
VSYGRLWNWCICRQNNPNVSYPQINGNGTLCRCSRGAIPLLGGVDSLLLSGGEDGVVFCPVCCMCHWRTLCDWCIGCIVGACVFRPGAAHVSIHAPYGITAPIAILFLEIHFWPSARGCCAENRAARLRAFTSLES